MDERELARRCRVLPDRFADRLGEDVLPLVRSLARGGEWDELVDNVIAALVHKDARVSAEERDELAALADALRLETFESLSKLNVGEASAS